MTVSQQYVDAVNAADGDTLLALFADGAVLDADGLITEIQIFYR